MVSLQPNTNRGSKDIVRVLNISKTEFNVLAIELKNKFIELNELIQEKLNSPITEKNYALLISQYMDEIAKLSIRLHGKNSS